MITATAPPAPVPWTVWLVPFLLSLLPLAGFYAEQELRASFEAEQRIGAWDERARQLATMAGTMATLETQVEHQAQRLRDRIEQDLLEGERWTGALLWKRFGQVFAHEFRRPGAQIYGFAGSRGESLNLLPGEGLAQARGALVLGLMKKVVEREPPGAGEVRALNRRCAGLLGPDITFSALRDHAEGRLMPGLQGGKDLRFLWMPVRPGGRLAGAFLLMLTEVPDPPARKAWLLRQLAGSADHLPALLPFAVYLPAADRIGTPSTPAAPATATVAPAGPDLASDPTGTRAEGIPLRRRGGQQESPVSRTKWPTGTRAERPPDPHEEQRDTAISSAATGPVPLSGPASASRKSLEQAQPDLYRYTFTEIDPDRDPSDPTPEGIPPGQPGGERETPVSQIARGPTGTRSEVPPGPHGERRESLVSRAAKGPTDMRPAIPPDRTAGRRDPPVAGIPGGPSTSPTGGFFFPLENRYTGLSPATLLTSWSLAGLTRQIPANRPTTLAGGWRVFRAILDPNLDGELWLFGRPGLGVTAASPALPLVMGLLAVVWAIALGHWRLTGRTPLASVRWRLLMLYLFLAGMVLFLLDVFGSFFIESARARRQEDLLRHQRDRIADLDREARVVEHRFQQVSRELLASQAWAVALIAEGAAPRPAGVGQAFAAFARPGLALSLDSLVLFHMTTGCRTWEGPDGHPSTGTHGMYYMLGFVLGCCEQMGMGVSSESVRLIQETSGGGTLANALKFGLRREAYWAFYRARQQALTFTGTGRPQLQCYDFVAQEGKLASVIAFRSEALPQWTRYLRARLRRQPPGADQPRLFLAARENRAALPLHPQHREFWQSRAGRSLHELLGLAASSQAAQREIVDEVAYLVQPGTVASTLLYGSIVPLRPLREQAERERRWLGVLLCLLFGAVLAVGLILTDHLLEPLGFVASGLQRVAGGDLAFRLGLDRADELGDLSRAFDEMIQGFEERRTLGRFVSAALDADLSAQDGSARDVPRTQTGVVLTSDIRSFTTLSEEHAPDDVVGMLNAHHERMATALQEAGGLVEQFIGDAVVAAFFDDLPRDAIPRALHGAIAMRRAHEQTQAERAKAGRFTYGIGIGIAWGPILRGTVRASSRRDHVLLGEVPHQAERLEACSKHGLFTRIVVAEEICRACSPERFRQIKGEEAWELVSLEEAE